MSGPTFGQPTIDDIIVEAEAGTYTEPTAVWVIDSSEWVIVVPPSVRRPIPIIYKTRWIDITDYETTKQTYDEEIDWSWSSPIISTVDDNVSIPYIETESCGPVLTSAVKTTNVGGTMTLKRIGLSATPYRGQTPLLYDHATYANGPYGCGQIAAVPGGYVVGLTAGDANVCGPVCIDYDGNELWRYTVPGAGTHAAAPWGITGGSGQYADYICSDDAGNTYMTFISDDGLVPAVNRTGVLSLDSDGNLRWFLATNTLNAPGGVAVTSDGATVVVMGPSNCTWTGGGAAEEIAVIDGATGALVTTYDATTLGFSAAHWPLICGATEDRVLWHAQNMAAVDWNCVSLADMTITLWTLDPSTDFLSTETTRVACAKADGGVVVAAGGDHVIAIDEDGVVTADTTVETLTGTNNMRGVDVGPDGSIYIAQTTSSEWRIAKLDPATLAELWPAFAGPSADSHAGARKLAVGGDDLHMCMAESGYSSAGAWVSMLRKQQP